MAGLKMLRPMVEIVWIEALFAVLAASSAIKVYNVLSGRDLLRDTCDKLRLASRSLPAWKAHWKSNPQIGRAHV